MDRLCYSVSMDHATREVLYEYLEVLPRNALMDTFFNILFLYMFFASKMVSYVFA